ncbi:MAG: hypothetical protein EA378_03630 [Phycisphaerales bacterium]|nr:MAG: hypothetical protein EA378_03630 [Phycisphaerales bacterium]
MADRVFLLHGWSSNTTTTYGALRHKLRDAGFDATDLFLGQYVSLDDNIQLGDLANALELALRQHRPGIGASYHFVTHSTGALVVRDWLRRHYAPNDRTSKVGNVVMVAAPQFGSRLAHHGRSMLAGMVKFGDTGREILHALELGSRHQWGLADDLIERGAIGPRADARLICITGDSYEDNRFKKRIFPAAFEDGSDGTVRTSAANINTRRFRVRIADDAKGQTVAKITAAGEVTNAPFLILPQYHHVGQKHGIIGSISQASNEANHPALRAIADALRVRTRADYNALAARFAQRVGAITPEPGSTVTAASSKRKTFSQVAFRFRTDAGEPIRDYRIELLVEKASGDWASKTVSHLHINNRDPEVATLFLNYEQFEPHYTYVFRFAAETGTPLVQPVTAEIAVTGQAVRSIIAAHRTSQIDVEIARRPAVQTAPDEPGLLTFVRSDDPDLEFEWDRQGRRRKTGRPTA